MAAFPRPATILLFLALLVVRPGALRASEAHEVGGGPPPTAQLQDLLARLRAASPTPAAATTGPGLPTAGVALGGPLFARLAESAQSVGPLLDPFGVSAGLSRVTSALPTLSLDDFQAFTRGTVQFLSNPVDFVTPEQLSPQVTTLLRTAADGTDAAGQAEAVAVLALLSAIFNLVSSIFYTVSGGLGVGAASTSVLLSGVATLTGPAALGLAEAAFASTLIVDTESNRDAFGKRWTDALSTVADGLNQLSSSGNVRAQLQGLRQQLTQASDLMGTALSKLMPAGGAVLKKQGS